jgi:signal transduction histidine kinase
MINTFGNGLLLLLVSSLLFAKTEAFHRHVGCPPQLPTWSSMKQQLQALESSSSSSSSDYRPLPAMPSELFQRLALSQFELLANSLRPPKGSNRKSKIDSMALYLPQENSNTGQLEFLPAVIYPHPNNERVFIASEADSGVAPQLPRFLTKLPGFAAPHSLLPNYPMVSSSASSASSSSSLEEDNNGFAGVGVAEEVLCDLQSRATALSVPLFSGSQTVGVLLVKAVPTLYNNRKNSSSSSSSNNNNNNKSSRKDNNSINNNNNNNINMPTTHEWTSEDREQIIRAAQTLSMALSMDKERSTLEMENKRVQDALSNSLHQVKNPLQALRTFGKLLQQRVAEQNDYALLQQQQGDKSKNSNNGVGTIRQLLDLTRNMMEQSDRVVNLLAPMDSIVDSLDNSNNNRRTPLLLLNPAAAKESNALVLWNQTDIMSIQPPAIPWETETLDFARRTPSKMGNRKPPPSSSSQQPSIETRVYSGDSTKKTNSMLEFSRRRPSSNQSSSRTSRPAAISSGGQLDGKVSLFQRNNQAADVTTSRKRSAPPQQAESASIVGDDGIEIGFVADVLESIFDTYKVIGADKGISFQVLGLDLADDLPGVLVRPKSLQEAVSNLLDNAFKYVGVSGIDAPKVRVRLMANNNVGEPSGVTILVEDNGPGILPKEAETVFERGFRSSSVSSWVLGTGLGLGISRALVESMGGRLDCLNQVDYRASYPDLWDGAAFRIQLYRNKGRLRSEDFGS